MQIQHLLGNDHDGVVVLVIHIHPPAEPIRPEVEVVDDGVAPASEVTPTSSPAHVCKEKRGPSRAPSGYLLALA